MNLEKPKYIEQVPGNFKWDDPWECVYEEPRMANRVGGFYGRAIFAIAIGAAEWVIWGQEKIGIEPVCLQFVEACWAAVVDRRYLNHRSYEHGEQAEKKYKISRKAPCTQDIWEDRETLLDKRRGPQFVAIDILGEVADRTMPKDLGDIETVYLFHLGDQVTNKSEAYRTWRRKVVQRMDEHYLRSPGSRNWLGSPVPREAMDPGEAYDPADAPELLTRFLSTLDYEKNPFLTTPKDMLRMGFKGQPYSY